MIDEIRDLYRYNSWANRRIFDICSRVKPEDFSRNLPSSYSSLKETLVHIISAEWIWLERWKGNSPGGFPGWKIETFEEVKTQWETVDADLTRFIESLPSEALASTVAYKNTAGRQYENGMLDLLRHVVNHSTYHRGQVTTILRTLGAKTVGTDLILYYRERLPA